MKLLGKEFKMRLTLWLALGLVISLTLLGGLAVLNEEVDSSFVNIIYWIFVGLALFFIGATAISIIIETYKAFKSRGK